VTEAHSRGAVPGAIPGPRPGFVLQGRGGAAPQDRSRRGETGVGRGRVRQAGRAGANAMLYGYAAYSES
jgi:hypothetical protein